jgi:hypothetical protein
MRALAVLLATLVAAAPAAAQAPDRAGDPGGALWRSLVVPGWGQLHNGQPTRAAVALGAVGGMVTLTVVIDHRYRLYRRAFLYASFQNDPESPYEAFRDDWLRTGARSPAATRVVRDNLRRNRDLAIIGTAAVYALQALEAYVSAHLLEFDVGEDLSVRVIPTPDGPAAHLIVRL